MDRTVFGSLVERLADAGNRGDVANAAECFARDGDGRIIRWREWQHLDDQ